MEDPVDLEENLKTLISKMETLESVKVHVQEKGERRMEKWIQNAIDKGYELQNQVEEVKRNGFSSDNLSLRQELDSKVMESLNEVKTLIQGANLSYNSIDSLMRELAFENPKRFTYEELKKYKLNFRKKLGAGEFGDVYLGKKPKRFTYEELKEYTLNFNKKLGSGEFGDVYLGQFPNGLEIAVKVLKVNEVFEFMFEDEVRVMAKTYHRHLVKLFGFCLDGNHKALVYEYLKNGSLDMFLYKRDSGVEWSIFYRIAVDTAKALAYLHDGCTDEIIHHDVKAANVLLDAHFSPRVTDFGLANFMDRDIAGQRTRGYDAPEVWSPFSRVTYKCDVYSFGMVLFEILGMRPNGEGNNWFPRRVWNMFEKDKLDDVIVGCGIREKDRNKAKLLTLVAFWCAQHTPETRPSMSYVAIILENEILVNKPPNPFLASDPRTSKIQPEVHYPQVSATTYSDISSSMSSDNVSITERQFRQHVGSASKEQLPQGPTMSQEEIEDLIKSLDFGAAKRFSRYDLEIFTSNFSKIIGSGAYGKVYGGRFANGVEVAVKVLEMNEIGGDSFVAEVSTVAKTDHHNVVKLFGFCIEGNTKALVYEYVENGSLDKILYTNPVKMEWEKLYSIATETAKALAYLHHGCEKQIIHYDIKPANILLDRNQSPKLTDFGLAKLMDTGESHHTKTRVRGTPGYMAPEIYSQYFWHVTFKCDVFSFGVLLFAILRRGKNNKTSEPFPSTVWDMFAKGKLKSVIEECGISEKDREKATILCMVALWCAQFTPEARPSMKAVATALEKEILVNSPPNPNNPSDSLAKMTLEQTSPDETSPSNESGRTRNPQDVKKKNQLDVSHI